MSCEKGFCFISCVNKPDEYKEALYYINRLKIPPGYFVECVSVEGASSMTSGCNLGMNASAAQYKIYLHQDVHIVSPDFLTDILGIFEGDESIGMIAMAGAVSASDIGMWWSGWPGSYANVYGCVWQAVPEKPFLNYFGADASLPYKTSRQPDGLLLATRTDIPWREDLFDNWHFYDLSQCLEFERKGYKTVIPTQMSAGGGEKSCFPWCLHNGNNGGVNDSWNIARERYLKEYADII